jgi:autotransporter-associated beta strand protein
MWRGTLGFTSDAALGNPANKIFLSTENANGALRFDANNITLASTRQIVLYNSDAPFPIDVRGYTGTVACPITGGSAGATLLKKGAGNLILAASNTFSGTTEISAGTLTLNATGQILGGAIHNDAVFVVAGGTNHTVSGISGTGTTSVTGANTTLTTASIFQSTLIVLGSSQAASSAGSDADSMRGTVPEPTASIMLAMAGLAVLAFAGRVFVRR